MRTKIERYSNYVVCLILAARPRRDWRGRTAEGQQGCLIQSHGFMKEETEDQEGSSELIQSRDRNSRWLVPLPCSSQLSLYLILGAIP